MSNVNEPSELIPYVNREQAERTDAICQNANESSEESPNQSTQGHQGNRVKTLIPNGTPQAKTKNGNVWENRSKTSFCTSNKPNGLTLTGQRKQQTSPPGLNAGELALLVNKTKLPEVVTNNDPLTLMCSGKFNSISYSSQTMYTVVHSIYIR